MVGGYSKNGIRLSQHKVTLTGTRDCYSFICVAKLYRKVLIVMEEWLSLTGTGTELGENQT